MAPDPSTLSVSNPKTELSYEAILLALFENYESIYDIDAETSAYQCYHESDSYSELRIAGSGEDFFAALSSHVPKAIHPEDCAYVQRMLDRDTMIAALEKEKYYSFVYRLLTAGEPSYHKIRATFSWVDGRRHILLGVRDVDETIRQEQAHTQELLSISRKEKNHMEAILASAAGYREVNLTQDLVLEQSSHLPSGDGVSAAVTPPMEGPPRYSDGFRRLCAHQIVENREGYAAVGSRENLLACFGKGEMRASVSFSVRRSDGSEQPCREVFFLYRDPSSEDVMAFCVLYDLTEQQRREKELRDLETALQMSRIRNFTSQMQPHFLYNALGSIQEVVLEDPQYASELIGDFTIHLRSCIRAMSSDAPIPFEKELANIKAYVNIETMRFGEKLRVFYDIPVTDFEILPISVQPLVENAIRHGIYERGKSGGSVTVRTRETPDAWIVEVEDDGVGFDTAALRTRAAAGEKDSTGLENIRFRLEKVMRAKIEIQSAVGVGTTARITVPKGGPDESDFGRR